MNALRISVLAILGGACSLPLCAAEDIGTDPVQSGQHAFESRRNLPWYDGEEDSLRPVELQARPDDVKRQSEWSADPTKPKRNSSTSSFGRVFWAVLRGLAWLALILLIGLVIWGLIWAATRSTNLEAVGREVQHVETMENRIENLPVEVSPQVSDLLAAAQAYYKAGELGKAIIYAFAHQLVELDKHHLIQLTRGKTNRQYLSELRSHPRFIELLTPMMLAFEDVYFGHYEMPPQRFQDCWNYLDRFHHQLEQVSL